jgi:DNA-binding response OmpR family regulator
MNIALIEDDPACSENYGSLLEDRGHKVTVYEEADDAVNALHDIAKTDLVILDLMMRLGSIIKPDEGEETGIGIYLRLRNLTKDLRILVLTARTYTAEMTAVFASDKKCRYVEKPVSDLRKFYSLVEEW